MADAIIYGLGCALGVVLGRGFCRLFKVKNTTAIGIITALCIGIAIFGMYALGITE